MSITKPMGFGSVSLRAGIHVATDLVRHKLYWEHSAAAEFECQTPRKIGGRF
jgi:hypothetical protein